MLVSAFSPQVFPRGARSADAEHLPDAERLADEAHWPGEAYSPGVERPADAIPRGALFPDEARSAPSRREAHWAPFQREERFRAESLHVPHAAESASAECSADELRCAPGLASPSGHWFPSEALPPDSIHSAGAPRYCEPPELYWLRDAPSYCPACFPDVRLSY